MPVKTPSGEGLVNFWGYLLFFPLSRAEHRSSVRIRLAGLSERSEFPRDPFATSTRRIKRDTGGFFWFVFFHEKENEQTKKKLTLDR